MRKYAFLGLLLAVAAFTLLSLPVVTASTVPDRILQTRIVTADETVASAGKYLIYSFKVYAASSTNAQAGLYDIDSFPSAVDANLKVENGEPTQYEVSDSDAIGQYPIECSTGISVIVDNGYAIIQYE
jgi:hypothetical protein